MNLSFAHKDLFSLKCFGLDNIQFSYAAFRHSYR